MPTRMSESATDSHSVDTGLPEPLSQPRPRLAGQDGPLKLHAGDAPLRYQAENPLRCRHSQH